MPWLADETIDISITAQEGDDDETGFDIGRRIDTLSNVAARSMKKEQLIAELHNRGASTAGLRSELLDRLLGLLDRESELMFTRGDRDVRDGHHVITAQADNAKPHIGSDNIKKLNDWGRERGMSIQVALQPPRSPDLNKLDMSVFRSLASRASNYKCISKNLDDLVYNVTREFEEYPIEYLLRTHAETFAVYREILRHDGGNDYPSPHTNIRKRQSEGEDIVDLFVDVDLVSRAEAWLLANPLPPLP